MGRDMYDNFAWVMKCIDTGRDRAWNRFLAPFFASIALSTWLKVYFPTMRILNGLYIIFVIALLIIISWFIFGFFWQRKLLQLENNFDTYRNPMFIDMNNNIKKLLEQKEQREKSNGQI